MEQEILKYAEIVSVLEQNNITFDGLVDGLVHTYHNDRPDYRLKQNPIWWKVANKDEIIESVVSTFSK